MKKTAILLVCTICLLVMGSCKKEPNTTSSNGMDGVYRSLGYGRLVKIANGEFIVADITSRSCIPLMDGAVDDLGDALQYNNDTLTLKDGINLYYFVRTDDAPAICKKGSAEYVEAEEKKNDPVYNFEVLWETFKEHYAYFELRGVNPDAMYAEYRPKISSEMSDAEFYSVVFEMLESFGDGHIGISAPDEIEKAAMALQMDESTDAKDEDGTENETPNKPLRRHEVSKIVAEHYIPEGTYVKNGNLRWGILQNNIGYLQLNQMMALADYGLSDTLSYREYWMAFLEKAELAEDDTQDELEGLNNSLDTIMKDFAATDAMIIDVRFNGGGKDEVGMAVLKRLNDSEKVVFTKKGRMDTGFTPDNVIVQSASAKPYKNPVYLLIGPDSASATEIMALSSLSMPNITRVGANTEGVFSDILDKTLPNGWEFGLSSEVYLDNKGTNYEGVGIPPDVEIGYVRDTQEFLHKVVDGLTTEGDEAIEKALQLHLK